MQAMSHQIWEVYSRMLYFYWPCRSYFVGHPNFSNIHYLIFYKILSKYFDGMLICDIVFLQCQLIHVLSLHLTT